MVVRFSEAGIHPVWFYDKLTVFNKYHCLCAECPKVLAKMAAPHENAKVVCFGIAYVAGSGVADAGATASEAAVAHHGETANSGDGGG